ncbi:TRAP transporter small permease [Ostreibacterium oceani]|uniref:TRAP transporter small permease protein n=1 Tax=Ostreibacterium oceani TaxID=2654998 RepID=A0A6N7ETD4_9GAMM|nr:TRAP transporter small permease subunit [Ostreibacterium oceani]MPV85183.1 TRAP transporter small permease subunit [Ostreibacterium oceani]
MDNFFRYTLTALMGIVALAQFSQVITRYVLEVPVMGMEELIMYPILWLYMLGAVNASRENTHIRANVLDVFIKSPRKQNILAIISDVISIIVLLWLIYWAWDFTQYILRIWKESPTLYLPTFYADISLLLCLLLMTLFTLLHIARSVRNIRRNASPEEIKLYD